MEMGLDFTRVRELWGMDASGVGRSAGSDQGSVFASPADSLRGCAGNGSNSAFHPPDTQGLGVLRRRRPEKGGKALHVLLLGLPWSPTAWRCSDVC